MNFQQPICFEAFQKFLLKICNKLFEKVLEAFFPEKLWIWKQKSFHREKRKTHYHKVFTFISLPGFLYLVVVVFDLNNKPLPLTISLSPSLHHSLSLPRPKNTYVCWKLKTRYIGDVQKCVFADHKIECGGGERQTNNSSFG